MSISRVGVAVAVTCADVSTLMQIELGRNGHVGVEVGLSVLDGSLLAVVEDQWAVTGRRNVRRLGVDAIELRNLVPESRNDKPASLLIGAEISLVAPADVIGAQPKQRVGAFTG